MTNKLSDIISLFPKEVDCVSFLEHIIWNDNPVCPYCKKNPNFSTSISKLNNRYHCNACNSSFSVMVKTIFSGTRCDLRKWFFAIYLLHLPTKKITARYLAEKIKTTKDTAWLMTVKINTAKIDYPDLLENIVSEINKRDEKRNQKKDGSSI